MVALFSRSPQLQGSVTVASNTALSANENSIPPSSSSLPFDQIIPPSYQGHPSDEIYNALVQFSEKMKEIENELTSASTFQSHSSFDISKVIDQHSNQINQIATPLKFEGYDSTAIAKAIRNYITNTHGQPSDFAELSNDGSSNNNNNKDIAPFKNHAIVAGTTATGGTSMQLAELASVTTSAAMFSLASLIESVKWTRILLCIFWTVSGSFLLFFGYASYFWASELVVKRQPHPQQRIDEKATQGRKRKLQLFSTSNPVLGGGIGGAVMGFLFMSFLSIVVTAVICNKDHKSISAGALFAIWLAPGFLGAFLGGHFRLISRLMTGLIAGPCLTLLITAMFGIRSFTIRMILVSVFTTILTGPLLVPRRNVIHFHLLNLCTSIVGMFTLLDGIALYAPPVSSSAAWIDLWTILFETDQTDSDPKIRNWGTSAFKGCIAGAFLGCIVGFLFEWIFHKHAAENPEREWNEYLESYTQRFENGGIDSFEKQRAGSFEPAPNVWNQIGNLFSSSSTKPAAYGNLSSNQSPLTERRNGGISRRASRVKSLKFRDGPAKFEALSKRERDLEGGGGDPDSDSEMTEYDSDSSLNKLRLGETEFKLKSFGFSNVKNGSVTGVEDDDEVVVEEEEEDLVRPLSKHALINGCNGSFENYRSYGLPRPPSYRANSYAGSSSTHNGGGGGGGGGITHLRGSVPETKRISSVNEIEKPFQVYTDRDKASTKSVNCIPTVSSPPSFHSSGSGSAIAIAATPSLINAINRIQAAQVQAKACHESKSKDSTPLEQPPRGLSSSSSFSSKSKDVTESAIVSSTGSINNRSSSSSSSSNSNS